MALNWSEVTKELIIKQVKDNIDASLALVRVDRDDSDVQLTGFEDYFPYEPANLYRKPALYVVVEEMDLRKRQKKANFVSALVYVNASIVVEERTLDLLTKKVERYQAAVHNILDNQTLLNEAQTLKCHVLVTGASFSPVYTDTQDKDDGKFIKEAIMKLEVEHYESLRT